MFAVVENEQNLTPSQVIPEKTERRRRSAFIIRRPDPKLFSDCVRHTRRFPERGKPDEPDPVRIVGDNRARSLDRKTRFADTPWSGEGEQPILAEAVGHDGPVAFAAYEGRQSSAEVRARCLWHQRRRALKHLSLEPA